MNSLNSLPKTTGPRQLIPRQEPPHTRPNVPPTCLLPAPSLSSAQKRHPREVKPAIRSSLKPTGCGELMPAGSPIVSPHPSPRASSSGGSSSRASSCVGSSPRAPSRAPSSARSSKEPSRGPSSPLSSRAPSSARSSRAPARSCIRPREGLGVLYFPQGFFLGE